MLRCYGDKWGYGAVGGRQRAAVSFPGGGFAAAAARTGAPLALCSF